MGTAIESDGAFALAVREALAFVRLATLLPRDLGELVPRGAAAGEDVVVLVHGALATAGAFRPLGERLGRLPRTHVATFSYAPRCGVVEVAGALRTFVERLPPGVRVHLVGHSLGGLSVRWFVQVGGSDPRVVQTIAVAAPFAGARGAWLLPGPAGRDMQAGSEVLRRLAETAAACPLPHLSIFGSADGAVPASTTFGAGDRVVVPGAGHNGLLFDPVVADHVVRRVREAAEASGPVDGARPG